MHNILIFQKSYSIMHYSKMGVTKTRDGTGTGRTILKHGTGLTIRCLKTGTGHKT
jgi:hypothetical protein